MPKQSNPNMLEQIYAYLSYPFKSVSNWIFGDKKRSEVHPPANKSRISPKESHITNTRVNSADRGINASSKETNRAPEERRANISASLNPDGIAFEADFEKARRDYFAPRQNVSQKSKNSKLPPSLNSQAVDNLNKTREVADKSANLESEAKKFSSLTEQLNKKNKAELDAWSLQGLGTRAQNLILGPATKKVVEDKKEAAEQAKNPNSKKR